jgi:hypothetical protein
MMKRKLNLTEMGNGFPRVGEIIGYWDDGEPRLFRVLPGRGSIETHSPGHGNTCLIDADEIDADDMADEIDMDADDLGLRLIGIAVVD